MIFQEPLTSLSPVYTCGEQVVEMLHQAVSGQEAQKAICLMKSSCPILGMMNRYPHRLRRSAAAGDCDRIGGNPAVLIADEPTTALDVTIQARILQLLRELRYARIFHSLHTHDMGVIAEIADQ